MDQNSHGRLLIALNAIVVAATHRVRCLHQQPSLLCASPALVWWRPASPCNEPIRWQFHLPSATENELRRPNHNCAGL